MARKTKKDVDVLPVSSAVKEEERVGTESPCVSVTPANKKKKGQDGSEKQRKPSQNLPAPAEQKGVQPSTVPVNFPELERRSMWGRVAALLMVLAVLVASALIFALRPTRYDEQTSAVNFFYRPESNTTVIAVNGKVRGEVDGALRYEVFDSTGRVCAAVFETDTAVLYLIQGKEITYVASAVEDCVLSANGKALAWRTTDAKLYYAVVGEEDSFCISGTATDRHYCLSPDGKELFYTSERDGSLQADVYSRTGTNPYQQENKGMLPIAIADDCRYLYYLKDGDLYVLPTKTGIPVLCGDDPVLESITFNRSCSELMFRNGTETRFFVKGERMLVPDVGAADTLYLKPNHRVAVREEAEGDRYLMDSFCDNYYVLFTGTAYKLVYLEQSKGQGRLTHISFVDGPAQVSVTDKYVFFLLTDKGESANHTNLWRCTTGKTEEERIVWDVSSFTPNVDGSRILYTNAEGALYSQAIGAAPVRLCDSIFGNVCGVTLDDAFYFFCAEGQLWVSDNGEAPRLVREGVTEVLLDCHTAYFLADVGDNGNGNIYANNRNRRSDEQIVTAARYMR